MAKPKFSNIPEELRPDSCLEFNHSDGVLITRSIRNQDSLTSVMSSVIMGAVGKEGSDSLVSKVYESVGVSVTPELSDNFNVAEEEDLNSNEGEGLQALG